MNELYVIYIYENNDKDQFIWRFLWVPGLFDNRMLVREVFQSLGSRTKKKFFAFLDEFKKIWAGPELSGG